jgi:hypothetical protein
MTMQFLTYRLGTNHGSRQAHIQHYLGHRTILYIVKEQSYSLTSRGGLWGCEILRIPHFLENWLTDGDEAVSLTLRPHFTLITN